MVVPLFLFAVAGDELTLSLVEEARKSLEHQKVANLKNLGI